MKYIKKYNESIEDNRISIINEMEPFLIDIKDQDFPMSIKPIGSEMIFLTIADLNSNYTLTWNDIKNDMTIMLDYFRKSIYINKIYYSNKTLNSGCDPTLSIASSMQEFNKLVDGNTKLCILAFEFVMNSQ